MKKLSQTISMDKLKANPANELLTWTFGLKGSNGKYFTVESFGDKLNVDGKSMKAKQIFLLETIEGSEAVRLRTPNNKYLSGSAKGDLTLSTDKGKNEEWTIDAQADGRWVFQSSHKLYLSKGSAAPNADGRAVGEDEKWTIHLAMHPQVCLRNQARKQYVHLEDGALNCNEVIPWGFDAVTTLGFHNGKYSLMAANRQYLAKSGALKTADEPDEDCKYIIEYHQGMLAFKDNSGNYLKCDGAKGKLVAKRNQVGPNELFVMEDSHPQVTLTSHAGKFASNSQAEDVKCVDKEVTDKCIFQMEIHRDSGKWAFRGESGKYWIVKSGIVQTTGADAKAATYFDIEWDKEKVAIKHEGKYLLTKPNGSLSATSGDATDECKYIFDLVNRPHIVFRCGHGFVRTIEGRNVLMCNGPEPEVFEMEHKQGAYFIKNRGSNGKYWQVADGNIAATSDTPVPFYIELRIHTHLALKANNDRYIVGEQQGGFQPKGGDPTDVSQLWEY